jgi:hypothetical protein
MRIVELPDLFSIFLENEGISEYAVVMVLNQGKTNQFGKLELQDVLEVRRWKYDQLGH